MKRIKKLLLLFLIFILSGCTVEYNLTINDDSSVNEQVVARENTNRMKSKTGLDASESVNYLYKMFDREDLSTKIKSTKNGGDTIATVTGSHSSLEEYSENFTSDIFENVSYTKKGNIVTLYFKQTQEMSSTSSRAPIYDNVIVNIKVPFKVTNHNAESVNKDTYTWTLKKDEDLKKIKISFDDTNYKTKKQFNFGGLKFNVRNEVIVIGILLFIVAIIAAVVYVNNKKNNKI